MNNENILTEGQEVWVKARIAGSPIPDRDGEIKIYTTNSWDAYGERYVLSSEIRTTEQILQEHGALVPQHKAIKYEYTMTLNGDFAIYQVIKYTATETEAMKELNRLNRDAQHVTKQQMQEIILTEPDFTNKLKVGDTVKIVERWGRKPPRIEDIGEDGFELNGTYVVEKAEDYEYDVRITNGHEYCYVPFIFLDLVEPAPEPKYWLHESPKTYSIYYKGQFGRVITAMLMQKDLYTLEEAQAECDRLNQKDQNNA